MECSVVHCQGCSKSFPTNEPRKHVILSLAIDNGETIEDALAGYYRSEELETLYACEDCDETQRARKELALNELPQLLVLQLKRFTSNGATKDPRPISFECTLDVRDHSVAGTDGKYDLMAVLVHAGSELRRGHYYICVRFGEQWLKFNDSTVTPVSWDAVQKEQAYLLFYEKHVEDRQARSASETVSLGAVLTATLV